MLQMDIEGAEYPTILATTSETLSRFRIIVVELHALGRLSRPRGISFLLPFFERLALHHHCVHLHPNNVKPQVKVRNSDYWIPRILEVTLIRKDRIDGKSSLISPQMPHPQDIDYNVKRKQPQAMGRNWSR